MEQVPEHLRGVMIDPWEYVRRVFEGELRRLSRQELDAVSIPPESKQYLLEVGLPQQDKFLIERLTLSFEALGPGLACLGRLAGESGLSINESYANVCCLDLQVRYGRALCLDDRRDGAIYDLDLSPGFRETFLNSRVERLGPFLAMYRAHWEKTENLSVVEAANADSYLIKCMEKIDPEALKDRNSWWGSIIEELISDVY